MAFHLKSVLIALAILVIVLQITKGQKEQLQAATEEEDDDSSSEQTVEENAESRKRRRRSLEMPIAITDDISMGQPKVNLPSIPGLPDPETIKKIAEILTTVGQQVLPIFVSGNTGVSDYVANRVAHDMKFFKKFKNELDVLSGELKKYMIT